MTQSKQPSNGSKGIPSSDGNGSSSASAVVGLKDELAGSDFPQVKKYAGLSATTWYQLIALFVISSAAVVVGGSFDREMEKFLPEGVALASTYNRKPSGLSAISEIARQVGYSCQTWEAPYRQLNDTVHGVLVIVDPVQSLQEFECEQILEWVDKGNRVIFVDQFLYPFTRLLLDKVGCKVEEMDAGLEEEPVSVNQEQPEFKHIQKIVVTADTLVKGGREILPHDDNGALIVEVQHGAGSIVVSTIPALWTNRRLVKKESWQNFQLFTNLVGDPKGDVMFDERCHGFTGASNVFIFLARGPVGLVVAQLLLILAVGCISNWQRFGAATVIDRSRKISNLEFIYGLANAYRRAKANTTVLEIIGQGFRHKICKDAGVSPHDANDKLVESWRAQAGDADAGNLAAYLADYDRRLQSEQLSDNDLKALICSLDKISERSKELVSKRK